MRPGGDLPVAIGDPRALAENRVAMHYYEPNFLGEALVLLDRYGERAHLLAGGTRVGFRLRAGGVEDDALINLKRITELGGIRADGQRLRIGTLATAAELERHPLVREHAPLLATAAAAMGATQLRTVATIGGNVASGDPASDLALALCACDAIAEVAMSGESSRLVPIDELLARRPVLGAGEVLVALSMLIAAHRASYQRMTTRRGFEMALVAVAVRCQLRGDVVSDVRVALAGAAPTIIRARSAERVLEDGPLSADRTRQAATSAADEARPHDDMRASAVYRQALVAVLVRRALAELR
jgi:aerobic carbon-monoxide dehydrogenase medium subunit